jgi:hypothetical protein
MATPADSYEPPLHAKKFGLRLRSLCALHPELSGHAMEYTELKGLLYVAALYTSRICFMLADQVQFSCGYRSAHRPPRRYIFYFCLLVRYR